MNLNVKPSDRITLAAVIDPDNNAAAAYSTGWVSMSDFANIIAVLSVGVITASGTVDFKLQQATDSAGAGVKDITGKAITQLTQVGSDDNKQVEIECRSEELDVENNFTHVKAVLTTAVAAAYSSVSVFGLDAREQPATQAATVAEVIA